MIRFRGEIHIEYSSLKNTPHRIWHIFEKSSHIMSMTQPLPKNHIWNIIYMLNIWTALKICLNNAEFSGQISIIILKLYLLLNILFILIVVLTLVRKRLIRSLVIIKVTSTIFVKFQISSNNNLCWSKIDHLRQIRSGSNQFWPDILWLWEGGILRNFKTFIFEPKLSFLRENQKNCNDSEFLDIWFYEFFTK